MDLVPCGISKLVRKVRANKKCHKPDRPSKPVKKVTVDRVPYVVVQDDGLYGSSTVTTTSTGAISPPKITLFLFYFKYPAMAEEFGQLCTFHPALDRDVCLVLRFKSDGLFTTSSKCI